MPRRTNDPIAALIPQPADINTQTTVDLDPRDAARLVRRVRGRTAIMIKTGVDLNTSADKCYPGLSRPVRITRAEAIKVLDDLADFNRRKAERGDATGTVEVLRSRYCLFIG